MKKKLMLAGAAVMFSFGLIAAPIQAATANPNPNTITCVVVNWNGYQFKVPSYLFHWGQQIQQPKYNPPQKQPAPQTPAQPAPTQPAPQTPAQPAVPSQTVDSEVKQVLDLVNAERAKAGLSPLKLNAELSRMATIKAQDMRDDHYFDHNSPTYGSPFDMVSAFGIKYSYAGENIAAGQKTPAEVMNAWMNSPGHRANILNKNYTEIGIGVAKGGSYGTYWVQSFMKP